MATNENDPMEVTGVKGVAGGYGFSAPVGTALPIDNKAALAAAFANMGFISSDGIKSTEETDSTDVADMNGDVVAVLDTSRKDRLALTLYNVNATVLKEYHGHGNVTASSGLITVKHNSTPRSHRSYVFELLLKDGRKWRKVVPDGQVVSIAEMTLGAGTPFGREMTIHCSPDASGNTQYDYIDEQPTVATGSGD